MPSIDFYFIPSQGPQTQLLFACRLLEKAYQQQHQIYVHLEDAKKAQFLDSLLWTFREESFIPHHLSEEPQEPPAPIQIGYNALAPSHQDILLNMHPQIPDFHGAFKRILEVIPDEPELQALAEEHRVFYAEKGYKISLHQLNK